MIKVNKKEVRDIYVRGRKVKKVYERGKLRYRKLDFDPKKTITVIAAKSPLTIQFNYNPSVYNVDIGEKTNITVPDAELTKLNSMFQGQTNSYNCTSISFIDLHKLDTSKVTSMHMMFHGCTSLEKISGLRNLDTSAVKDIRYMFSNCKKLVLSSRDIERFDTSNVTSMYDMFYYCSKITELDLRKFDTSNVTDMQNMFGNCLKLEYLDLSSFDTSNVTNMSQMFYSCIKLESIDLSTFDTSKVTDVKSMFEYVGAISLDLSKFDPSSFTSYSRMFARSSSIKTIRCTETFRDWCWEHQDDINLPNALRKNGTGTWQEAMMDSGLVAGPVTFCLDADLIESEPLPEGWFEDTAPVGSGTWEIV